MKSLYIMTALAIATISPAKADAWKHPHSKMEVPDQLAGLNRGDIRDVENNGLDVVISFDGAADGESTTVYIFRNVAGDVPVWLDRATAMLKARAEFSAAVATGEPAHYVPPVPNGVAGLSQVFSVPGNSWKSTAVAVLSTGDWYVKARLSSKTLSAEQLAARLADSLAAIKWPVARRGKAIAPAVAVSPIAPCAAPLSYAAKAEAVAVDPAASLMSALIGAAMTGKNDKAKQKGKGADEVAETWCRDGKVVMIDNQLPIAAVYRRASSTEDYLLALADSGRAMMIGPNANVALLDKDSPPSWTPRAILLDKTVMYQDVSGLAAPEQLFALFGNGKVVSSTPTFGKNRAISIDLPPEK